MAAIPDDPLAAAGIAGFAAAFRAGSITSEDVTRTYLTRIAALDGRLGAYEHVAEESAIETACAMDRLRAAGTDLGPLMGLPVSVKDLFTVAGMPTFAGSNIDIADLVDPQEGPFIQALRRAGCVLLGKTRMVEFALGITGVSTPRGTPRNPWDDETHRLPGGSSSGAGVAVAAGLCALAVGTDTGGSVRVPAALCGVVGLKTTFGLWPTAGVFPLAPHLDSIGLLTRSADDATLAHQQITALLAGGAGAATAHGVAPSRLRLGVPANYFNEHIAPEVVDAVQAARSRLESAGVAFDSVTIASASEREDYFPLGLPAALIATLGEKRFEENRSRMDPLIARRAGTGLDARAADYLRLENRRTASRAAAAALFENFDAWICATTANVAAPLADLDDPDLNFAMAMGMTRNTQPVNYLGLCAVTLPLPRRADELPVGLQLIAPAGDDARLLKIAQAVETIVGRAPLAPVSYRG